MFLIFLLSVCDVKFLIIPEVFFINSQTKLRDEISPNKFFDYSVKKMRKVCTLAFLNFYTKLMVFVKKTIKSKVLFN